MASNKRRWVVVGVSDDIREAVTMYADLYGLSIAQVLDQELKGLHGRIAIVRQMRRDLAAAETGRAQLPLEANEASYAQGR